MSNHQEIKQQSDFSIRQIEGAIEYSRYLHKTLMNNANKEIDKAERQHLVDRAYQYQVRINQLVRIRESVRKLSLTALAHAKRMDEHGIK